MRRVLSGILLSLIAIKSQAAQRGEFCVENNLYGVFYAVVNCISIGVTVEKNGQTVFPESGEPHELGWGSTWCRILQDFPEDGDLYNACMKDNVRQLGL